jgi:hypothetical protein
MADGAALEAFWLPDAGREIQVEEQRFGPGDTPLLIPRLTPGVLRRMLEALKVRQRRVLATRPLERIIEPLGAVARRLSDPGDSLHVDLLEHLPGLTGYSREMIAIGLQRMSANWVAEALRDSLEGELGDTAVLEAFQPRRPHGRQRAYGPTLTVHIFSGNIPGVSVSSLIRALCVKSSSLGKTALGEPYFAVRFARALAEVDRELAECMAVTHWAGGSRDLEDVAFSEAEAVVAYGSDETISDVGCRVPPHVRYLRYPNRVGAALISRSALSEAQVEEVAERAARDVIIFDQQGCVAPHTIYVEKGGEVDGAGLARRLAAALDRLAAEVPRGVMTPGESIQVHQLRAEAEMRGAMVLASARGTEWTVILEEGPGFQASPLNRVIYLRSVEQLDAAVSALAGVGRHLQTVAVAGDASSIERTATALGACGATRIVSLGEASWPSSHWHHDGRFQFLDLLRFVDLED